jgi:hypothetical protein
MLTPSRDASVPDYRAYIIGSDGHFEKAVSLVCADDDAAIESAKQLINGRDVELWQRDRRIARFDTRPKDTNGWQNSELHPPK